MNRITVAFLVVFAALMAGAESALAAIHVQEVLDPYLRIEYDVSPAAARTMLSGYVYNQRAGYRAERMQLSIERLDAAWKVIETSSTWVLGGVPPGSRAFFSAKVEPAASYRVQVLSFEWTQTQMGGTPSLLVGFSPLAPAAAAHAECSWVPWAKQEQGVRAVNRGRRGNLALHGERLGHGRRYLLFFQPFLLGYAIGRVHQLADQRRPPQGERGVIFLQPHGKRPAHNRAHDFAPPEQKS
jgi:hypothetical protein